MKNLLNHHYSLALSEAMVFCLGSGPAFLFIEIPEDIPGLDEIKSPSDPSSFFFGRSVTMEIDLCKNLQIDFKEEMEFDNQIALEEAKKEIQKGEVVLLTGDTFYLDYGKFKNPPIKVHFPSHRFVMIGYDQNRQVAFIMDRDSKTHYECSFKALTLSRNPKHPFSTFNKRGVFTHLPGKKHIQVDWRRVIGVALATMSERMVKGDLNAVKQLELLNSVAKISTGLQGIKDLLQSVEGWKSKKDKKQRLIFAATNIEKYGTGGGNFRRFFVTFLKESKSLVPSLIDEKWVSWAEKSANKWTELSQLFFKLTEVKERSEEEENLWKNSLSVLCEVVTYETLLFESIFYHFHPSKL
eukprot:TRINITY_DN12601_c0_g1_i1.p1 TRINITY_DN12601_c0_g1~~TRINITY_DN12601_c0_g1_i1.p1  ORF type:complete len:363 (-),score=109.31 TRINITY_DN12601_c0_g1_i1:75-1136(-)